MDPLPTKRPRHSLNGTDTDDDSQRTPMPPTKALATAARRLAPTANGGVAASFTIHPLGRFRGPCPSYKEPAELASFSYDATHSVRFDDSEMANLSQGFESQIRRDPHHVDHLDGMLEALVHLAKTTRTPVPRADFVTYRGMMTKIFCTPFARRDKWEMNATRYKGTIYIEDNVTAERIADRINVPEPHQRMMYWGYRFEQLVTTPSLSSSNQAAHRHAAATGSTEHDDPLPAAASTNSTGGSGAQEDPVEAVVVDTNREYCSVFKTQLGRHRIIMAAEIDCVEGPKPSCLPNRRYVEIKTNKVLATEKDVRVFERQVLARRRIWAQSFLAGIPKVVIGYRDERGYLQSIQEMYTRDLPRMVRGKPAMWEANVCMNFAEQLLAWLAQVISTDDPCTMYRISFDDPFTEIRVEQLPSTTGGDGCRAGFLLEKYLATLRE
ncbi:decapping endonuclease targeting mRNA [Spiromyces aspiralis]|uniref:Decapping endonuclease targeting mRNA n=1 Tax=Spiromyces aspiralis TaxID=68401 RepID=A0ACC1HHJ3_9FUNG|nr:decapping endonuclease targeting mRNA [Spiromyces aspiralis]